MHRFGERLALPRIAGSLLPAAHVVQKPLTASRHREQLAVVLFAPSPGHAQCLESAIESHQVPVALGFGQGAIDVPEQGPDHAPKGSLPQSQVRQAGHALHERVAR